MGEEDTMELRQTMCCGVHELSPINEADTPITCVQRALGYGRTRYNSIQWQYEVLYERITYPHCSLVTFTQATLKKGQRSYGFALADYIEKEGLGKVTVTIGKRNPNTGNYITHFAWDINKAGLKRWARANCPPKPPEIIRDR
jgi:hypothetical protein